MDKQGDEGQLRQVLDIETGSLRAQEDAQAGVPQFTLRAGQKGHLRAGQKGHLRALMAVLGMELESPVRPPAMDAEQRADVMRALREFELWEEGEATRVQSKVLN